MSSPPSTALAVRPKPRGITTPYGPDMKKKAVALAKAGKPIREVSRLLPGPSEASIRAWVNEANGILPQWKRPGYRRRGGSGRGTVVPPARSATHEMVPLEEVRQLREERDYLKNVVLWLVPKLAPDLPG